MPVAVNCLVNPFAMLGLAGVTAIDTSSGAVIVNIRDGLVIPDKLAVIAVVPTAKGVARPVCDPIVAALAVPEFQVAEVVTSCVVPSV